MCSFVPFCGILGLNFRPDQGPPPPGNSSEQELIALNAKLGWFLKLYCLSSCVHLVSTNILHLFCKISNYCATSSDPLLLFLCWVCFNHRLL